MREQESRAVHVRPPGGFKMILGECVRVAPDSCSKCARFDLAGTSTFVEFFFKKNAWSPEKSSAFQCNPVDHIITLGSMVHEGGFIRWGFCTEGTGASTSWNPRMCATKERKGQSGGCPVAGSCSTPVACSVCSASTTRNSELAVEYVTRDRDPADDVALQLLFPQENNTHRYALALNKIGSDTLVNTVRADCCARSC